MTTLPSTAQPATTENDSTAYKSLRQPAWHVVLLSMFSFCFYLFYWYYKTARDLKLRSEPQSLVAEEPAKEASEAAPRTKKKKESAQTPAVIPAEPALSVFKKINPFWLTVALIAPTALGPFFIFLLPPSMKQGAEMLVPALTLGFFFFIFLSIAKLGKEGSLLKNNSTFPAFCLVMAMVFLYRMFKLPGHFYLLFTLTSVPVAIAQHWLNDYYERTEPANALQRRSFSMGEILTLLAGSALVTWILLANI